MVSFEHKTIEEKWRKKWREAGIYDVDLKKPSFAKAPAGKWYNLMMFPYPSAEGLHVGNMYAFTGADVFGRFKAMNGFQVFEPIGLDGFGIHSENYSIKIGKHPVDQAKASQKRFYGQLERIGNRFSWEQRLETYDPKYYRWTQWLFIQMFKHGLAYRKKASVNWCPSCKTVLADEQVENGVCERCQTAAEKRENEQWFFKITDYAQRLLDNIAKINWPEKIKLAQRNWIGRSEGAEVDWEIVGSNRLKGKKITTFTTRLDTIYGVTFLVLAPEHPLVGSLATGKEVRNYVSRALLKTEQQRKLEEKTKSGVPTSYSVTHPLTGKLIPIWIADFVLKDYGTGAVMGVPAHDERDKAFAEEHKLPIVDILVDKDKVYKELAQKKSARKTINYHLRDWCISRQRYWGPPIPMMNCPRCGWVPEKEGNLPVKLPYLKDFKPTGDGKAPLAKAPESWRYSQCPQCGHKAKREIDVSDTFLDSSWYYLRYLSVDNDKKVFDPEITKRWLPVDAYIGGAEHAVLHLMYSRFIWMALQDWGYLPQDLGPEPFPFLYGHGLLISHGAKMSKSRGNVIIPDDYMEKFGTDALRLYLMFIGPYDQGGDFQDTGMAGMKRFLNRVWQLVDKDNFTSEVSNLRHRTIKRLTEAMSKFRFNVGIAALMEYVNELEKEGADKDSLKTLILLLAPFAPYITEELWQKLGGKFSVHQQAWPKYQESLAKPEKLTLIIQVNGKLRAKLELEPDKAQDKLKILALVKQNDNIKPYIKGKKIIKEIWVSGKLVNLVVG